MAILRLRTAKTENEQPQKTGDVIYHNFNPEKKKAPETKQKPELKVITNQNKDWLDTTQFADLAGITKRNAQIALKKANEGKAWRKTTLQVRLQKSPGYKGITYQVYVPSLPTELTTKWYQQFTKEIKTPTHPKAEQKKMRSIQCSN